MRSSVQGLKQKHLKTELEIKLHATASPETTNKNQMKGWLTFQFITMQKNGRQIIKHSIGTYNGINVNGLDMKLLSFTGLLFHCWTDDGWKATSESWKGLNSSQLNF